MDNFNAVVFIFTKYETNVKKEMMPFWRAVMHVQVNKNTIINTLQLDVKQEKLFKTDNKK